MRTSLDSIALRLNFHSAKPSDVPVHVQHYESALKCVELLGALGTVLGAFPDELRGNEIWSEGYAIYRAEQLATAMRGVGTLAACLADSAMESINFLGDAAADKTASSLAMEVQR